MCFFDDKPDEFHCFRMENRAIEQEYLKLRQELQEAKIALRQDAANQEYAGRVNHLTERLQVLEKEAPWLTADIPQEVALWGQPFG